MKKQLIKLSTLLSVIVLLLGLPLVVGFIADLLYVEVLDPDGAFLWISIHYIAQMIMFLMLIIIIKHVKPNLNFGFNFKNKSKGLKYVLVFTGGFLIYTVIGLVISKLNGTFVPYQNDLNARNVFGYLGFQLLLSGPSEEILFRAFGMTVLGVFFKKRIFKDKVSINNLFIAIIFGLAHIGIYFSPFGLSYNVFQLVYAFVLGLIYGDCYEKTESVFYPMMLHSISNVIAAGITMLFS